MYSLKDYYETVNVTIIILSIITISFIVVYFINVLRHKADKPSKVGFVLVLIMIVLFCIVDFKSTIKVARYAMDYKNAKTLKFEVVEGTYEEKDVIRESGFQAFLRETTPNSTGSTSDAPDIIVRDKVNGVWLNTSLSDAQFTFDGSATGHGRYRVYYLKHTKIIARIEKLYE